MADSLDIEQPDSLRRYLEAHGLIGAAEALEARILSGGVSNRTVLVRRAQGEDWVLKQALSQLRVDVEWFSDPRRVHREAAGMRALARLLPDGRVPHFLFEDFENHLLAMTAVPRPHVNWKAALLQGRVEVELVRQFGEMLGILHRCGWQERATLGEEFADDSFFESLRLEPYYAYSAEQVPAARPFLTSLMAEARGTKLSLVHGDYSPKNLLVHDGALVLLDHEVIHFGDPAFDLGFSLTHLLSKAHHMAARRDVFKEAALLYWRSYVEQLGAVPWRRALEERAVRHTLGCLLARVAGRSPLEYLTGDDRRRQGSAVLFLMQDPPRSVPNLIDLFLAATTPVDDARGERRTAG